MTPAKPGFRHEIESGVIKGAATLRIVQAAKSDRRLMRLALRMRVEETLGDRRREAPAFGPRRHRRAFLAPIRLASDRIEVLSVDGVMISSSWRSSRSSAGRS